MEGREGRKDGDGKRTGKGRDRGRKVRARE